MGVLGGAFNPVTTAADNFYYWERTAPDRFELRTKRFLDGIDLGSETMPALADLDGDGDLDLAAAARWMRRRAIPGGSRSSASRDAGAIRGRPLSCQARYAAPRRATYPQSIVAFLLKLGNYQVVFVDHAPTDG